ncbi:MULTISPECIES: hypothetical protein [unclassified Streptomyces]|uniref:hypothetical protein n=1 Tax=Streptomyces TaxID=1883 RepID=UPI000A556710|nr:hypothetical protein [Streptomyces sp. NRRL F-5681]
MGLILENLTELFEITDHRGSGQIVTFFAASWDGDESDLLLAEGVKLQFFAPDYLHILTIPPFIRNGIYRHLAAMPS